MATYIEFARTNYFKVKDEAAFKDAVKQFDVTIEGNANGLFALIFNEYTPTWAEDEETGEEYEIDFMVSVVAPHLQEDSIAILTSVGHERMYYVGGYTQAVNHEGKQTWISLHTIVDAARQEFGDDVEIWSP